MTQLRRTGTAQVGLSPRPCPTCGEKFVPYRDSQKACSRSCREKLPEKREVARKYFARADVKEKKNAQRRVENNPARREKNMIQNLRRYGLTIAEHEAMVQAQDNKCAICGNAPDPNGVRASSRLHVDHDHDTGAVRGLLCTRCNRGVGYFRDSAGLMREAARYIERYREP